MAKNVSSLLGLAGENGKDHRQQMATCSLIIIGSDSHHVIVHYHDKSLAIGKSQ